MPAGSESRLLKTAVSGGAFLAVTPDAIVAVGPTADVQIDVASPLAARAAAVDALSTGSGAHDVAALLGIPERDAAQLIQRLEELGVLKEPAVPAQPDGSSLAAAIECAVGNEAWQSPLVWTAEEVLLLPPGLDQRLSALALRNFVAGLRPDGRLYAYCMLTQGAGLVRGDIPDPESVSARLAEADVDPALIAVIELAEGRSVWTVHPDALDRIGAAEPHRLGPVLSRSRLARLPLDARVPVHVCSTSWAVANPRHPTPRSDRVAQGTGSAETAVLAAHAEAAERYASADLTFAQFVHSPRSELDRAIEPQLLYARNERQQSLGSFAGQDPSEALLWCPAQDEDGERVWVPAGAVYATLPPPDGTLPLPTTSSGVAAHTHRDEAVTHALCELVERDAFMWTWVQRQSRERIAPASVPADVSRWVASRAAGAWTVTWVNLSLETFPVILCAATGARGVVLGTACCADPVVALRRATIEALALAVRYPVEPFRPIEPREVRTPRDHLLLHSDPCRRGEHEFLYASADEIPLPEVPGGDGLRVQDWLRAVGIEPLTVDFSNPVCAPYVVVRAVAVGLVPITFGWDNEPLGLRALAGPRPTRDGRTVGNVLDLGRGGPIMPHPFS